MSVFRGHTVHVASDTYLTTYVKATNGNFFLKAFGFCLSTCVVLHPLQQARSLRKGVLMTTHLPLAQRDSMDPPPKTTLVRIFVDTPLPRGNTQAL